MHYSNRIRQASLSFRLSNSLRRSAAVAGSLPISLSSGMT